MFINGKLSYNFTETLFIVTIYVCLQPYTIPTGVKPYGSHGGEIIGHKRQKLLMATSLQVPGHPFLLRRTFPLFHTVRRCPRDSPHWILLYGEVEFP